MSLEGKLEEHWPPSRVIAKCGECDGTLIDTEKTRPHTWSAGILSSLITVVAVKHQEESGHDDLQVDINSTTPVREIDATITVNG